MKSYLDLIPISAKVHKRQNRMTLSCIVIAVFLVTAIFSMTDMAIRMEKTRAVERQGDWHIQLRHVPDEEAKLIAMRPDVAAVSWFSSVNDDLSRDVSIEGKEAVVCGADEVLVTEMMRSMKSGRFPQSDREILLTANAEQILGLRIGDTVTAETPAGGMDYTISGFGGDAVYTALNDGIGAFLTQEAFLGFSASMETDDPGPMYYVLFKKGINARKAIGDIRKQYGLTDENLSENTAILGLTGFSSNSYVMGFYAIVAILMVLILTAGVLMIAGSLNSKIAERARFFGMLRCIGASRAQIIRFVRLEALYWCKTAVPIGVVLGVSVTWGLCAILRFGIGGDFGQMPLFQVSAAGIFCGIAVGILTVFISAQAPAKRAARVSPMAAVTGGTEHAKSAGRAANTRFFRIETALGVHHAAAAKKNLFLMTGSFALSIVMFLSFSSILAWTNQVIPSLREWTPELTISSPDASCTIPGDLVAELETMPGVKRAFGRMYRSLPAEYQGKTGRIDLISYEAYQFRWAENTLAAGDVAKVLAGGSDVLTVFDDSNSLKVGDRIWLGAGEENQEEMGGMGDNDGELFVAGVLETSPFDSTDTPTVICSEDTFRRLTGENAYAVIDIQLTKRAGEGEVNAIRALTGDVYRFSDRREVNREARSTYWMFNLFVYGFLAVIAMITVLNIINSISMSVAARLRQYGAMRAVGMDGRQVAKMIAAETATYVLAGFAVGCAAGLPLHRFLFSRLITAYWGTPWKIPLAALGVIVILIAAAAWAAAYAPAKRIRNMMVTETINEL